MRTFAKYFNSGISTHKPKDKDEIFHIFVYKLIVQSNWNFNTYKPWFGL